MATAPKARKVAAANVAAVVAVAHATRKPQQVSQVLRTHSLWPTAAMPMQPPQRMAARHRPPKAKSSAHAAHATVMAVTAANVVTALRAMTPR